MEDITGHPVSVPRAGGDGRGRVQSKPRAEVRVVLFLRKIKNIAITK